MPNTEGVALDIGQDGFIAAADQVKIQVGPSQGSFRLESMPQPDGKAAINVRAQSGNTHVLNVTVRGLNDRDNLVLADGGDGANYQVDLDTSMTFQTTIREAAAASTRTAYLTSNCSGSTATSSPPTRGSWKRRSR